MITILATIAAAVALNNTWLALRFARRLDTATARLNALRRNCYLTDTDGVRRRYGRVSPARQMEAERG